MSGDMGTSETKNAGQFRKHPIHLSKLGVKELFIESYVIPDATITVEPDDCFVSVTNTPYDSTTQRIAVSLRLKIGMDEDKSRIPYSMRIELVGIFQVDETQFPVEYIDHWAKNGAPLVLYPYLRDHAFSLSSKCGFMPLLLPLVEVPTFKIDKPGMSEKRSKKKAK